MNELYFLVVGSQFFFCMRFRKYSLLKPCFGSVSLLVSVFSSLGGDELFAEGAGAEGVDF